MSRVAVVTHVDLTAKGVVVHAIRATEIAHSLTRRGHDVTMIWAPDRGEGAAAKRASAVREAAQFDVAILPSTIAFLSADIKKARAACAVVLDLFDAPLIGIIPDLSAGTRGEIELERYRMVQQYSCYAADRFICATPEQRLWLLGILSAWGRLNTATYHDNLVMVIPTGVPRDPPAPVATPLFRGRVVPKDATVILWPGGVYSHYRPIPLLDVLPRVLAACPNAYVVFVGASNAAFSPDNPASRKLYERAEALNAQEKRVIFEPGLPYAERHQMYADADVAVCLFDADLETELSFRTRLIDVLWGGMPIVTSRGNALSQLIEDTGSGFGVTDLNEDELASVLIAILTDPVRRGEMAVNSQKCAAEHLRWDDVVAPLDAYCKAPVLAADSDGVARKLGLSAWAKIDRLVRVGMLRITQKRDAMGLSS